MRHLVVRRLVLGLVAVLAAAALAFAWRHAAAAPPGPAGGVPAGAEELPAELFERHCAGCHDAADLATGLAEAPDSATAVLDLLAFLVDHGATDAAQDRAVAAWLWRGARAGR